MARQLRRDAVAEVGGERRAGVDRARSWSVVAWVCPSETPTRGSDPADLLRGVGRVRRHGDHADQVVALHPASHLVGVQGPHQRRVVHAPSPLLVGDERALDVDERHRGRDPGVSRAGGGYLAQSVVDALLRVVTTVGTQVVTPTPARASVIPITVSTETSGALRSRPRNPLTCRSTSPAARTGSPSGGSGVPR